MKKLIVVAMSLLMFVGCFGLTAFAEEALSADVYITVANKGNAVVAYEKLTVTDIDKDGALTINDALYAVHKAKYNGGAEAGYASARTDYGLSIAKLWGDTSGSYGYYINDGSAWSLSDSVKDGDHVYAFVYSDAAGWSDSYSYFDVKTVETDAGKEINLKLTALAYDESWNLVPVAVEGAVVTVDGVAAEVRTDKDGKATVVIDKAGSHVISATCESMIIAPPVCLAEIKGAASAESESESTPPTGDAGTTGAFAALAVVALAIAVVSVKKRAYED